MSIPQVFAVRPEDPGLNIGGHDAMPLGARRLFSEDKRCVSYLVDDFIDLSRELVVLRLKLGNSGQAGLEFGFDCGNTVGWLVH